MIDRLLNYTIEHNKIAISLATLVVGALAFHRIEVPGIFTMSGVHLLLASLLLFGLSVLAGGIIAAHLSDKSDSDSLGNLWSTKRGWFPLKYWRHTQHWCLWLALFVAGAGAISGMPL